MITGGSERKEAAMGSVTFVPLDIHKKFSKAVVMNLDEEILGEDKVPHDSKRFMREFFSEFEPGTDVLMEATFNWPWIADLAEELGLVPHLGDPMRLHNYRKGLAKSDRKDTISQGIFWARGNYPEVYLAPQEVRAMRSLFRTRLLLVHLRTCVKNSVHGVLHKCGILIDDASDIFSIKGRAILKGLDLDDASRKELTRKLQVIDDLDVHVAILKREIKRDLVEDERAKLLLTLPGVAELTAYAILAEIGTIDRFPTARALAAYAGLLPLDNESAGKDYGKKTGSHSNRFLKWAMLEAVSGAVRKSRRMRSLHSRVRARNKKKAGKARVAVARELLELAHLVLTRKVTYTETPPPRPGSEKARQPDRRRRAPTSGRGARRRLGGRAKKAEVSN